MKVANDIRAARFKVKHYIETDFTRDEAANAILDPARSCDTLVIYELLCWVPFIGRFKAMKICGKAMVPERRRLGELTDRQRTALVEALRAA